MWKRPDYAFSQELPDERWFPFSVGTMPWMRVGTFCLIALWIICEGCPKGRIFPYLKRQNSHNPLKNEPLNCRGEFEGKMGRDKIEVPIVTDKCRTVFHG